MAKLAAGYSIVMKQKVGSVNTPLYPFTAIENVFDKNGTPLNELIGDISGKNFVPDYSEEATSNLRFLRNDNTWADIQDGSTTQKGVVQLTNDYNAETASNTLALTQAGGKALYEQITSNYVANTLKGAANGVATLDANGLIPSSQLPGFVDEIIEGYRNPTDGLFYEEASFTTPIAGAEGKIYVDLTSKKIFRWGGQVSGFVEISESLALGETSGTAYEGSKGKALADKLDGISAGANKVEASETNGNIKIDGTETTVFTPDTASGSQAGYMSAADFTKLGGVSTGANKVEASETNGNIKIDGTETNVFTPDNASASQAGYMSAADFTKLAGISGGSTKVEASATNGNIKIDDVETTVFTPDNASASQAGYMSAADFSKLAAISEQANKVEASTTNGNIKIDGTETTVFTPDTASTSQAGYMTAAGFNKLAGCEEITVSATAAEPTFSSGSGLWFEEVSAYTPNPDPEP